jgi:hypothetical protein
MHHSESAYHPAGTERHVDPRKGEFTTTVTDVNRTEPTGELFVVPASYRIVDVTPEK